MSKQLNTKETLKYASSNHNFNEILWDDYKIIKTSEFNDLKENNNEVKYSNNVLSKNFNKEEYKKNLILSKLNEKDKNRFQNMLNDWNSIEDSEMMLNIIKQKEDKEKTINDYRKRWIVVDENWNYVPKPEERFNVSLPDISQFSSEDIKNSWFIWRTVKTWLNALWDVYQVADWLVSSALNPIDTYNTIKEVWEWTKLNLTQWHQLWTDREEYLKELSRKAWSEMVKSYTDTHNSFNEDPLLTALDWIPWIWAASKVVWWASKTSKIWKIWNTLDKLDINKIASNKISDWVQKVWENLVNKSEWFTKQSEDIKNINNSIKKYQNSNISWKLEDSDKKELIRERVEKNYLEKNKEHLNDSADVNSYKWIEITSKIDSNKKMNDFKEFNLNNAWKEKTKQYEFERWLFKDNNNYKITWLSDYIDDVLWSNWIKRNSDWSYNTSLMNETHSRWIMIPLVNELKKIDLNNWSSIYDLYKFRNNIDELRTVFNNTDWLNSNVFKTKLDWIIKHIDDNLSKTNSDYRNSIKLKKDLDEWMKSLENNSNWTISNKIINNMTSSWSIYFWQELKWVATIWRSLLWVWTWWLATVADLSMKMFTSNKFRNSAHDFWRFVALAENSPKLQKFLERWYWITWTTLSVVWKTLRELWKSKITRFIWTNAFRFWDWVIREVNDYRNEENKKLFEQKIRSMNDEQERYRYH